jgi:hypothetical protein
MKSGVLQERLSSAHEPERRPTGMFRFLAVVARGANCDMLESK